MQNIRLAIHPSCKIQVNEFLSTFPIGDHIEVVSMDDPIRNDSAQIFIEIANQSIKSYPDWYNHALPFVFPNLTLNQQHLLGLLFYHLGLYEDALAISNGSDLHPVMAGLLNDSKTTDWLSSYVTDPFYLHNLTVFSFYQELESTDQLERLFSNAIAQAGSAEIKAYTLKHYLIFAQDRGAKVDLGEVKHLISNESLIDSAKNALKLECTRFSLAECQSTGKPVTKGTKEALKELCTFYQEKLADLIAAELLSEMSWIAATEENFAEALGYLDQLIRSYEAFEMTEHLIEAYVKQASILHQWSKSGSPQFYKQTIEAYQSALKLFKQNESPYWFADIHHQLGVIYAEMPEEQQKRAIWAAVSASSFQEALAFFTKDHFPYEYASVCHNYATALVNYPVAIKNDNIEKALHYFNESLAIRTVEDLSNERIITLLNYLEASWEAGNVNEVMERVRLKDMKEKAEEILSLTEDPAIVQRVQEHLRSIQQLRNQAVNA